MTPDVTFKAWYDGKIKVAAVTFHENYSAGGHCLFQFSEQAALPQIKSYNIFIHIGSWGHI